MSFQIKLITRDVEFECDDQQTILQAAIEANVLMPHGCRAGQCGRCKHRVVSGTYYYPDAPYEAIDGAEIIEGLVLCCQAQPTSDMVIDSP